VKPPPQTFTEVGFAVSDLINGKDRERQAVVAKLTRYCVQPFIANEPQITTSTLTAKFSSELQNAP
jgi:hypothetical protein